MSMMHCWQSDRDLGMPAHHRCRGKVMEHNVVEGRG